MEVVAGKCLICDECNYVLSGTDKKVYLDLLQRFNIVDGQYSTRFSKLFNSNGLCVICAYGLKSCAANLETIKKKAKTKKRTLSDKSCSLCVDTDNVFLCITILKDEILTYLDSIKADIDVDIKRICINCFHCVTVHNNLSKRVRTLMTQKNITDSETDSGLSKKRSGSGKNKLENKRKRELRATTRNRGFPESPTSDSDFENPVFKRRRLSKQTKILSKKNKNNVEDLDDMLQHLETVDAVIKTTNIDLNFKASADERMMFDISYVRCDAIEDKQKSSNIATSTASIEISDDDVTETRTSGRVAKRPNYALILKPKKHNDKSALKCATCGEHFPTAYRLKSHSKASHESSEMNGNVPVRQTRSKAARKEMYYDTDSEAEHSKSEHSTNESESPKVAQSSRSQKKVKMSGNKTHKKEQNSNKLVNTKEDSPKNSRSLKRKIGNKGSEDDIEKDDSKSEHESELDSDIQKKSSSEKVARNLIDSSDEKNTEDSEIEDDNNTKKSKELNKDDVTNISETENENNSEHVETDDADNTVKPKEKLRPSKQKNKSNVKKTSSEEKSDHSDIEDDDTDKSKSKVHLQKEKRSSNESQNNSDEDNVELSKRMKKNLGSEENNSVNKTNKGKVSDINSKTRSPKGKQNNIKDKEACDNTSESEHESNLTKNKSSPKIKKTKKDETSEEHLEKEKSKLPEGENNNENVDETEENEKSEKEIEDEDNKSTDDNPVESSETAANSSKEKITLSKEQETDESEKDIEATDKDSENGDAVQNSEEQKDITIAEKSKESPKNVDSDAEEIADNEVISINEESNEANDKENEIEEQTLTKEDEDNDRLVVNEEKFSPDNGTITINEDAASDTTEILTEDFSLSQKITNEETNPAGSNEIEVNDDNSETDTLKLSSASTNDTENEKTGKADKSTGKNNPSDFNYVEKLLENLGAMANGNKERTFKIQLSSAKDSS